MHGHISLGGQSPCTCCHYKGTVFGSAFVNYCPQSTAQLLPREGFSPGFSPGIFLPTGKDLIKPTLCFLSSPVLRPPGKNRHIKKKFEMI